MHTQFNRRVGDQTTDFAQADDAQRVSGELDATEILFAFFHPLVHVRRTDIQIGHEAHRAGQITCRHQQAG